MQTTYLAHGGKRIVAAILSVLTMLLSLPLTVTPASAASDTVTVRSQGYTFSYNAGGTWTSQLDGFSSSDGSMTICTQLDVNPPGPGGATYKLATNLGSSYKDGDITISTKFAFKVLYYASKNRSNAALRDLDTYELSLAANCVTRGYFSNLSVSDGIGSFSQNVIRAAQTIRSLANADADKIDSKITISDGIATCENGDYTARMAFYTSTSSNIQRVMLYAPQWKYTPPEEENGQIEVYKKDASGEALAGAIFTVYDSTGKEIAKIGPTDSKGYAQKDQIPFGTYTAVETTFPANYTSNGTTSWTVTVNNADTPAQIGGSAGVTNVLKKGTIGVVKEDEFGNKLSGVVFGVYSDSACKTQVGTITTGSDGSGTLGNLDCTKTFYVKETKAQHTDYVLDTKVYPVTVVADTTTWVNNGNSLPNFLKKGALSAYKTDKDGNPISGVVFGVYTNEQCTNELGQMTTGSDGIATYGVNTDGTYSLRCRQTLYVKELRPKDDTYVYDDTVYPVTIAADKVTSINGGKPIINARKYWELTLVKADDVNGTLGAGDATVIGAVYGLFDKNDQLIKEYTIGDSGSFTTDQYLADTGYYLQETKAPEGYRADPTKHILDDYTSPLKLERELTSSQLEVGEVVKTGTLSLVKFTTDKEHTDDFKVPEEGAQFQVYLKSAGSYEGAVASGDDRIYDAGTVDATGNVIWSNGGILSKEMAYGTYIVHQVSGWEGRKLIEDFEVEIKNDHQNCSFVIENPVYTTKLVVNKRDSETGTLIVETLAKFKIRDVDTGKFITYTMEYPVNQTIDEFETNGGSFTLPVPLAYGNYELIETQAPHGYVLNKDPIPFSVTTESPAVTTVDVYNTPQKGIIEIKKTGEVFSSVIEKNGLYQPVYSEKGLAGAQYEVTAAVDIITPDGTIRYNKGDIVDTVITGDDGKAVTDPLYLGKYNVREVKAPYGMVLNDEVHSVELAYAGQEVTIVETATGFVNDRQKVQIDLLKVLEQNDIFSLGMNGEITAVTFGLYAAEELTAADGSVIPADGLLEIISCNQDSTAQFVTDLPMGAALYVQEIATDEHYILSDTPYPVVFEYAGQEVATVHITVNAGEAIGNELIYGTVQGLKIDRETETTIAGALFGLFRADETEFTEETAILKADSKENGIFKFENVPFGNWLIRELRPAEGFLPNEEIYPVTVTKDEEIVEITVVNDCIPEISTTAAVEGAKEIGATEVFTLEDVVTYQHLIPGKEYVLKGVLMDKTTGQPLLIDGQEIRAETAFIPEEPSGEVTVPFTFDSKYIKEDTDIVVFETLYRDDVELTVHADIDDEGQTVMVHVPEIGTTASVNGGKEAIAGDMVLIEDIVSYTNLTPGKEYSISGVLMDKNTGQPFLANGQEVRSEVTFTPENANGEIMVTFQFDGSAITTDTTLVVFETLYREGVELAAHADIDDKGQTVLLHTPPAPPVQTGDDAPWETAATPILIGTLMFSVSIALGKRKAGFGR